MWVLVGLQVVLEGMCGGCEDVSGSVGRCLGSRS